MNGNSVWLGVELPPTMTLTPDHGDRVIPDAGSSLARCVFDLDISPGPIVFALVLDFDQGATTAYEISFSNWAE